MIDIHSHLLFGVDDGSRTLEESVHVIKKLSEVGYTDIILTPHYINDSTYVSTREENLDVLKRLKVGLIRNNVNVNLYLGNEIYIDSEIANLLKNHIISALNDTKYLLSELPRSGENEIDYDVFLDLINMGYKVILAHPERYISFQKDFNKVYELKELGVLLQSNVGSILGDYGRGTKKTIKRLLKENLITFMGTDIHHNKEEYTFVLKAKKKMGKYLTQKQINNIFENNAKVLLNDKIED